jgi:cytochrome c oxidase subunit 2
MFVSKLRRLPRVLLGAVLLLGSGSALADYALNMREGVTSTSRAVYDVHMIILWVCVAIGVVVFGVMFYSVFQHRKSKGAVAAQFHENTTVEIVWTIIPFLILVGMAIPATKTLVALEDTSNPDLTIQVTGYQWKWKYDYLDEGISFFSNLDAASNEARQVGSGKNPEEIDHYLLNVDNPVVVPINKKIRILTTANDVIHSWWVPDLGWKRDAIPGFINESWTRIDEPGTYRGQCAELCGKDHGFMPIVLVAKTESEYKQWVAQQKSAMAAEAAAAEQEWSMDDLMARGEKVYNTTCASCHLPTGEGLAGVFPALKGSPIATGPIGAHLNIVLHGKSGTAMQAFGPQLSDADLAAVITYERNAWGNNTGDTVQPSDIKAAR